MENRDLRSYSEIVRGGLDHFARSLGAIDLNEGELTGALALLCDTKQPVICSGVGKSGFIAAKLVATMNSLGVRATYLNPVDALHGDLGSVAEGSVVILISNSGTTVELTNIVPSLRARNCKIISLVSTPNSPLGEAATHVLAYGKVAEVDEHGLAPTTSTVVQLAIADILAATVSRARAFKPSDFYRNHPAGALGKRLMKVDTLMRDGEQLPTVKSDSSLIEALSMISAKRVGCTCVTDEDGKLVGLITDGDLRKALEKRVDIYTSLSKDVMQTHPQTAKLGAFVEEMMQSNDYLGRHFTVPVVDDENYLRGILVSIDLI